MPSWIDDLLEIKNIIQGSLKSTAIISALISSTVALINGYLLRRQNKMLKESISEDVTNQIQSDFYRQNIHLESERKVLEESVKMSLDGLSDDQYLIYQLRWMTSVSNVMNSINHSLNSFILKHDQAHQIVYRNDVNTLSALFYQPEDNALRKELENLSDQIIAAILNDKAMKAQDLHQSFNELVSKRLKAENALLYDQKELS